MAVIILKTAIELCGGSADFHVPHRIREGYDMRDDVIERAAAAGIRLIISVDMGIRAFAPAETAKRLGVDLIVTDHHLPGPDGVPHALAVVNPNQNGCDYPYKQLCGAGVAFKVAQGLMQRRLEASLQNKLLMSFMKVVAIATIADAVPLTGENRVFASLGLDALRKAVNPGLKALLEVAQISTKRPPTSGEVGFRIAPRINAAGRMDVARDVIELFSVKDPAAPGNWPPNSTISTPTARKKSAESCALWTSASPAIPPCATLTALSSTEKAGTVASSASPQPESSNATTAQRWSSRATVQKHSAPAAPSAPFTCSKRSSPAARFLRATAVTPTPADSPCPQPTLKICE